MKKKLTKTQVKRKLKTATNALYDLLLDKMGHGADSGISMSFTKLYEIHKALGGTMRRAYK